MLLKSPQQQEILKPNSADPTDVTEYINSYIEKYSCDRLNIDISFMNIIDACYVSTLCSTKHFAKYPKGEINWKVSSKSVEDFNKNFELGNNHYFY